MTQPNPHDFLLVGSLLAVDTAADLAASEALWLNCEDARARSAVSRGYYAAFRVLKSRLLPRREEWRRDPRTFPSRGVHEKIRDATEVYLHEKHPLVREMKSLLRRRNQSDYMFTPVLTCEEIDSDLVAAEEAIRLIGALTDRQLDGIALELYQREASAKWTGRNLKK